MDTGNNYTITTRHHHHIFKTRPQTSFSSKLPNHNFVNIWNEIDENLKLCSSKVLFKQLLRERYTALYLSHVHCLNKSCLECFGQNVTVVTTNNGTIKSCVSVHKCKHQLIDIYMQFLAQLASFTYSAI